MDGRFCVDEDRQARQENQIATNKLLDRLMAVHAPESTPRLNDARVNLPRTVRVPSKPTHEDIRWLKFVEELPKPQYPSMARIKLVVAQEFGITPLDIISARRSPKYAFPRQIAFYLSKSLTPRSLPEIGRHFGGKDHTTVLHGVRKIERLLKTDDELADRVAQIKAALE